MFNEYIKLPLHHDGDTGLYVRDANNHIVGMVISTGGVKETDRIIQTINETIPAPKVSYDTWVYLRPGESFCGSQKATKPKVISTDGTQIILRGWGLLTGMCDGCFKLSPEAAIKVQDSFGEYIEKKLNHE